MIQVHIIAIRPYDTGSQHWASAPDLQYYRQECFSCEYFGPIIINVCENLNKYA